MSMVVVWIKALKLYCESEKQYYYNGKKVHPESHAQAEGIILLPPLILSLRMLR